MSCTNRLAAAAALVGLLGMSSLTEPVTAQTSATASIAALAHVSGIAPLTATGMNDLNFGVVAAGALGTVTAANAGRFNVSGQPTTPVTVSFALPTVLTGAGSTTIPISFGVNDGLLWTAFPTANTPFNPNAPFFTNTGTGNMVIGIMGTVAPPLGTTTGNYAGTIVLTVAY
jgi:hypothetical protein